MSRPTRQVNHWVSGEGPFDRCRACGEAVPNASEAGPCIITGDCRGLQYVPRELLCVCTACRDRPPYFGVEDASWPARYLYWRVAHPGWCMICHAFLGDAWHIVPRVPPVVSLLSSILDAAGLAG